MPIKRKTASYLNQLKKDVGISRDLLITSGDMLDCDLFQVTDQTIEDIRSDRVDYRKLIKETEKTLRDVKIRLDDHKAKCREFWEFF